MEGLQVIPDRSQKKNRAQALVFIFLAGAEGFDSSEARTMSPLFCVFVKQKWLGWRDSNPRMVGPEPTALPLGDIPSAKYKNNYIIFYSLLKASAGSFLLAARAGIRPPIKVSTTDNTIKNKAILGSSAA